VTFQQHNPKTGGLVNQKLKNTNDTFYDVVGHFIDEVIADPQAFVRIAQHQTGSAQYPGLVISLTSCPNGMAEELHEEIDELVDTVFLKHGIKWRRPM
jgi:hypothetical protein